VGTQPNPQDRLPYVLLALTAGTGIVDAVSFLGLGRIFTANMTGNIVFMGFAAAGVPELSFTRSGLAVLAFLGGAAIGGRGAIAGGTKPTSRWPATAFALEAALLLAAALASISIRGPEDLLFGSAVIALTGMAMGIRNATTRKLAVPGLTTTVLTMTITSLAADSPLAGGHAARWRVPAVSVLMMLGGAALGTLLLRSSMLLALAVCSVVAAAAAAATIGSGLRGSG